VPEKQSGSVIVRVEFDSGPLAKVMRVEKPLQVVNTKNP
jgi:hypothetical protein